LEFWLHSVVPVFLHEGFLPALEHKGVVTEWQVQPNVLLPGVAMSIAIGAVCDK